MYIDLHNHYLPNVDDGVRTIDETLRGLELALREKVTTLCFTPHIWEGKYNNRVENLLPLFEEVKKKADYLNIKLFLSSEVFYSPSLSENFAKGFYIPYGDKRRYLLVELPVAVMPQGIEEGFYKLMLEGVEPILAHPERYSYVQRNIRSIFPLAKAQVPFQVTTQAIVGLLGSKAQNTAIKLLDDGLVSLIASDAHDCEKRPLLFREAVRFLNQRYGHTTARILSIENPRRVLEGKPLLPVKGKKGRYSKAL